MRAQPEVSAVLAAAFPKVGIGLHGVAVAFGLTILTMAYAIGHVCPAAISTRQCPWGCWSREALSARDLGPYLIAQVAGAIAGAGILYLIASGAPGFSTAGGFASNGFGEHSPGGYSIGAGSGCEVVMTFFFLVVILGATDRRARQASRRSQSGSA